MIIIKAKIFLWAVSSLLALTASAVFAQGNASLEAEMNYKTNTVELTYNSPLEYPSYISVVMTDSDVTEPQITDYIRIAEGECTANGTVMIPISIGSDIADGVYKFFASASGYDALNGEAQTEIKIIGSSSSNAILEEINRAPQNGVANLVYNKTSEILGLEEIENSSRLDLYIYNIIQKDFNGKFNDLYDVKSAWIYANMLYDLSSMDVTAIPEFLNENNDIAGLDLTNEDYQKQTEETCRIIRVQCGKTDGISCINEFRDGFVEAVAVAMINKSAVSEKDTYFKKYTLELGISDLMARYYKLDALKVARQFDNAGLNSAQEVRDKFKSVINSMEANSGSSGGTGSSGGSGGSGGSGSSSSLSGRPSTNTGTTVSQPQTDTEYLFTDVSDSHWAIESIKALKTMNIIDGYDDGSFKPDKEVTREEFVKLIAAACDISTDGAECDFSDVSAGDWFYPYVAAVNAAEIVTGIDENTFGTGQNIKRQDAAVILDRMLIKFGVLSEYESQTSIFNDSDAISDYALQSVGRLTDTGIINGIDGSFEPMQPVSRAQASKMIYSCMKYRSEGGTAQ